MQESEEIVPKKRCTGPCGQEYLATTEYWHRKKHGKYGLNSQCKKCVSQSSKNYNKVYLSRPEVQEHRKAYKKAYRSRPEAQEHEKAYVKAYRSRPEVQEHRKARSKAYYKVYYSQPEKQENRKAYMKAYNSRPEVKARNKDWYRIYISRTEILEHRKARAKAYNSRPDVQEHSKTWHRDYYRRPGIKEHKKAYDKVYSKAYHSRTEVQERRKVRAHIRRSRKRSVLGTHSPQQIKEQLKRQRHKCYYCQKRLQKTKGKYIYHIDHTFPLSRVAGTDIPANDISYLVLACPTCNLSKGNKFPWEFPEGNRLC